MARVALISTGHMEWEGLGPALSRLFPGNQFVAVGPGPFDSMTSCDAQILLRKVKTAPAKENNADKLIQRAAFEAMKSKRGERFDLVVIVDDLELENVAHPDVVCNVVRSAVDRHLAQAHFDPDLRSRTAKRLRSAVSFHLAKPMIESWIFADSRGPTNAGVPPERVAKLQAGLDPEDFATDDPQYDAANESLCACWLALSAAKQKRHKVQWVASENERTRHPKAYMAWLCLDPAAKTCSAYRESHEGVAALSRLNWGEVLGPQHRRMPFLRSLIDDLADGLEQDPAIGVLHTKGAPETCRLTLPADPCLRNL